MTVDLSSYKVAASELSSSTKFDNFVQAVQDALNTFPASQISGYPSDPTKLLQGDGSWGPGAWTTYTPAITGSVSNPTLGSGSQQLGRSTQLGKVLIANFNIAVGGAGYTNGSGIVRISLPANANAAWAATNLVGGEGWFFDSSAGSIYLLSWEVGATVGIAEARWNAAGGASTGFQYTTPVTIAQGDVITGRLMYEAA
jgi:hypothetical protein